MPTNTKADKANLAVADADGAGNKPITWQWVEKLWMEGRTDIAPQVMQYWMNFAFFLGVQWIWYDYSNRLISPIFDTAEKQRERATINRMQSAIQHSIAVIMKNRLVFEVPETSADDYVRTGARKSEAVLRGLSRDQRWEEKRGEWLLSLILGGTAAFIDTWDPDANRYSPDIKTGEPKIKVASIDDFIVEPGSNSARDARWCIHRQVIPAEEAQAIFNLPHKPPEDGIDGGPWSEKAMQFNNKLSQRRGTQVLWYYERPNRLQPQGQICAIVNHKIVFGSGKQDGRNGSYKTAATWTSVFPYRDHLNINVGRLLPLPNKWYGETYVTQAISPQRQINQIWTKLHENTHRVMNSKLLIDQRHVEATKKLNDDTQDPITLAPVDGAPEPHYLDPPKLAPHVLQELDRLNEELDNIMGLHDTSRGQAPSNIESGLGLNYLTENDSTPTGRIEGEEREVFGGVASHILELVAAKVTETRETSIMVARGVSMPVKWTGKELAGQTTAIVPEGSGLPQSQAGRLELATKVLQMRPDWFKNFSQFAKLAFTGGLDEFSGVFDTDSTAAEYENYMMSQGVPQLVDEIDNDAVHIQVIETFMKSREYKILPQKYKDMLIMHRHAHLSQAAHKVGQQQFHNNANPMLGMGMAQAAGVSPMTGLPGTPSPGALPPGAPQGAEQAGPAAPPTGEPINE